MSDRVPADGLERECRIFTRYLIGQEPEDYVIRKYYEAHSRAERLRAPAGWFDEFLVRVARAHPWAARIGDAYTAMFRRRARFRDKCVLLLAILEVAPSTANYFERPDKGGRVRLGLGMAGRGVAFAAAAVVGTVLLGPVGLVLRAVSGRSPGVAR